MKLLLATGNPGKMSEMKALLRETGLDLVTLGDLEIRLRIEETGGSYRENAGLKALAYARAFGLLTLADDSGLEVEALGGAPGIFSARYAPQPGATDADRRRFLLQNLQGVAPPWRARFCCTVAIATPEGETRYSEGTCEGVIIPEERGVNGFGYDPIFLLPEFGRTMAELSMSEKNLISHRALAIKSAMPVLLSFLQSRI